MEKFETLDYDVCENTLYRERKRNYSEAEERTRNRALPKLRAERDQGYMKLGESK